MLKKICGLILLALLSAACGGSDSEDGYFRTDEQGNLIEYMVDSNEFEAAPVSELGTLEAPFTSKTSATGTVTHGVQTGTANGRCSSTSTSQTCRMPGTKAMKWQITAQTGTTAAEVAEVKAVVGSGIAALFTAGLPAGGPPLGWTFVESTSPTLAIVVNGAASSQLCSGTGTETVRNACIIASNTTSLTESLPGNYVKADIQTLHIDLKDIKDLGSSASADAAYLSNAVRSGLLRAMGRGLGSAAVAHCGNTTLSAVGTCNYSPADICSLSTVNQNNTTSYAVGPSGDCGF